jgi:hypothetical protein
MQIIRKQTVLIGVYVSILMLLLLSVITTPLFVRTGIPLSPNFILGEEVVETGLIAILCCISFFIGQRFLRTLKRYRMMIDQAGEEKSRLVSRLAEAFSYIGTINVEIQEIDAVLGGVACYPETRKAYRQLVRGMAAKAMAVAATPWLVVRMVDRQSGQTIDEHTVHRPQTGIPTAPLGNRAILEGRTAPGVRVITSRQQNLDLKTVFILPAGDDAEDQIILLSAILNQIEMLFLLFRSGGCNPSSHPHQKEIHYASNH